MFTGTVTANGEIYCLQLEDPALSRQFYANWQYNKDYLKVLLQRYAEEIGNTDYPNSYHYMYSLAYILQEYSAGIKVMKLQGDTFRQKDSKRENNKLKLETCKY